MGLYRWDEAVSRQAAALAKECGGRVLAAFAEAFGN